MSDPFAHLKIQEEGSSLPYADLWMGDDPDAEAAAWKGPVGSAWADRNPRDVDGTNASWRERFGVDKVRVLREVAHGIPSSATWLEVGCSSGAHMRCIQAAGWPDVSGCDVNAEAIVHADNAVWADARSLPWGDDAFDVVTTSGSLMHMGPEERMVDCLAEMFRVAKGWFLMIEIYHATGTLISFGDLLPPAWVMPWREWVAAKAPEGWSCVRGRILNGHSGGVPSPLVAMLFRKD